MEKLGYYYFNVKESPKTEKRNARRKLISCALYNTSNLNTIKEYVRFWEIQYYQDGLRYS